MLPSPAKRAWTMNPRPEWVVTVRMTGTSTETYSADRCATAPSLQNPQHRLRPREGNSRRPADRCYSLTADDDAAADEPPPAAPSKAPLSSAAAVGRPDIGLPVSFGVVARRRRPIGTPDLPKQAYLRSFPDEPVAEIVQCGEPAPKQRPVNDLQDQPIRSIELPQGNSLI